MPNKLTNPSKQSPSDAEAEFRQPGEAVAYLRVASIAQADHPTALERQLETCQQYARNRGLTITRIYTDAGISGNSPRRPALDRMLRKLSHGRIGYLITANNTRLACDPMLHFTLQLELGRYDVTPISSPYPTPIDMLQRQHVLDRMRRHS
jgi:DNA invertase Pin-like site-specific DNA recombinase